MGTRPGASVVLKWWYLLQLRNSNVMMDMFVMCTNTTGHNDHEDSPRCTTKTDESRVMWTVPIRKICLANMSNDNEEARLTCQRFSGPTAPPVWDSPGF